MKPFDTEDEDEVAAERKIRDKFRMVLAESPIGNEVLQHIVDTWGILTKDPHDVAANSRAEVVMWILTMCGLTTKGIVDALKYNTSGA
jgi:hypothetical protein